MSNNSKKLDTRQISLFEMIQQGNKEKELKEGSLNISSQFRKIVKKCLSNCKYKPTKIAGRMMEYLDNGSGESPTISHHLLYAWEATSKIDSNRMPAEYIPAFCYAVESFELIEFLAQQTNMYLLPSAEALRSEIQRINESIEKLKHEKEKREYFLNEIEKKD